MTEEKNTTSLLQKILGYFTHQDLCIIVVLALLAFLTSSFGLQYILPGGGGSTFVHGFLKLPGPGAGIFISSAFSCLWLVLGLLIIKKPGTALLLAVLVMAICRGTIIPTFFLGGIITHYVRKVP